MRIGKRKIQKILSECAFETISPGPMKIIAEVGNKLYFETRAIETIISAQTDSTSYDDLIIRAIQLLILAKLVKEEPRKN